MRRWAILPQDAIASTWPLIEPLVQQACKASFDKYSPSDFLAMLLKEEAQLWTDQDFSLFAISDVVQMPNKRYARLTMGMGERPLEIEEFIVTFEAWARSIGCDGVQSEMRPGFAPQFSKAEWKKTHVLMEKEFIYA